MKDLIDIVEGFFNNVGADITSIKKDPKHFPEYTQAWHDALYDLLESGAPSQKIARALQIYKIMDWDIELKCYEEGVPDSLAAKYDEPWGISADDWYKWPVVKREDSSYFNDFINELIKEFEKGAAEYRMSIYSSGGVLNSLFDGPECLCGFYDMISCGDFSNKPYTKKYYNIIRKNLGF